MSLRDTVREKSEARYFAMDTLKSAIEWIKVSNPQSYLFTETTKRRRANNQDRRYEDEND